MKTKFLGMMALIVAIAATTACQKDKTDDTWKNIPTEQISVESGDAIVEVNDVPCTYGNVQLVADGKDAGTLTLTGIVPGYQEVKMPVELQKKSDGTFAIKGSTIVSTPPSIAATIPVRSTDDNPCYALSAEGTVKIDGTVDVAVTTQVQNSFSASSLAGTWALVRRCEYVYGVGPKDGPVQITWNLSDGTGGSLSSLINLANAILCPLLTEVLDQVTFDKSGNIMARYWPNLDLGDEPVNGLFKFMKQPGADGYYDFTAGHTDWVDSPKANLAFWYATGNFIYVVPNVAAIIAAEGADGSDDETSTEDASGFGLSEIMELLSELQELGVDVNTLNTEIQKALQRGVELKYSLAGENLKIYADKELCAPVIEALLPALPVVDAIFEQLAQSTDKEDKETYAMLQMLMRMIGIEKPSDISLLWNATTEFEIAINFTKA